MTPTKLSLLLAVAPVGLALGGSALGADMVIKAPLYKARMAAEYSWTGWYIGANAGYGLGYQQGVLPFNNPVSSGAGAQLFNAMPGGGFGGGQFGYNFQLGSIVLGIETDIQGAGLSDTRTCVLVCTGAVSAAMIDQKLNWFGTTRARAGLATGPVLSYVTGGAAYGGTETGLTTNLAGATASTTTSATKSGFVWGTGVEAALGGNWTAKAEYLQMDLGSSTVSTVLPGLATTFSTKNQEQIFRGGVNYRFSPDQSAAIGPTYNWAGLFVGGTLGYGIGRNDSAFVVPTVPNNESFFLSPRGFDGGGIVGYNWQFGRWVAGLETDFQGSTGSGYLTCVFVCAPGAGGAGSLATTIDQTQSWFGTTRGRLGYAIGPALFYGTAGAAYGQVKESITQVGTALPAFAQSFSHTKSGFAAGGGIENKLDFFGMLGPNWTTRTEYLYLDLGSISDTFTNGGLAQTLNSNLHEHVWRTVISYKFGA